jgi:hypothetical protein
MHAMVGETDKTKPVLDVLQWAEQSVDFNTFNLPDTAASLSCLRNLVMGTTLSLLLF